MAKKYIHMVSIINKELNVGVGNQIKLMKDLYLKGKCVHIPYERKPNRREILLGNIYILDLFEM